MTSESLLAGVAFAVCHPLSQGGRAEGTAFLIDDKGTLVTCAHVIDAVERLQTGQIQVATIAHLERAYLQADILPETTLSKAKDVAFLRIPIGSDVQKPDFVWGSARNSTGNNFLSFGFPEAGPILGLEARGMIRVSVFGAYGERFQLESKDVRPGFSGAPVYDQARTRIIGMIQAALGADRLNNPASTAFMISADLLKAFWPLELNDANPYVGLSPYGEATSQFFHGRATEGDNLLETVESSAKHIMLLGVSGSGKTSLVQAYLVPSLRNVHDKWDVLTVFRGSEFYAYLRELGITGNIGAAISQRRNINKLRNTLLIIDQAEELFLRKSMTELQSIRSDLQSLLHDPAITLLTILRDEFYAQAITAFPKVDSEIRLAATLDRAQLKDIISAPAVEAGRPFGDEFISAVADDSSAYQRMGRAALLPLLEFSLSQVWDHRERGEQDIDAYRAIGGIGGSLSSLADKVFADFDDVQRTIFKSILLELVRVIPAGENTIVARRPALKHELAIRQTAETSQINVVLSEMVTNHLIVTSLNPNQAVQIDIIHESLLSDWGRLRDWIGENQVMLGQLCHIDDLRQQWLNRGRRWDQLLRGDDLRVANSLSARVPEQVNRPLKQFITRSTRFRQVLRISAALGSLFLILAIGATAYDDVEFPGHYAVKHFVEFVWSPYHPADIALKAQSELQQLTLALAGEAYYAANRKDCTKAPWRYPVPNGPCQISVWDSSQGMLALAISPETTPQEFKKTVKPLLGQMADGSLIIAGGWRSSRTAEDAPATPTPPNPFESAHPVMIAIGGAQLTPYADADAALWYTAMLAAVVAYRNELSVSEITGLRKRLSAAQAVSAKFYDSRREPAFNLFPGQHFDSHYDSYATAMALFAGWLSSRACVAWRDSEPSQFFTQSPASDITTFFEQQPIGTISHGVWQYPQDLWDKNAGALDYQIATELLLQAEDNGNAELPSAMQTDIRSILQVASSRTLQSSADIGTYDGRVTRQIALLHSIATEDIEYSWYPWALATSTLWYRYARNHHGIQEQNEALDYAGDLIAKARFAVSDALSERTYKKAELTLAMSIAEDINKTRVLPPTSAVNVVNGLQGSSRSRRADPSSADQLGTVSPLGDCMPGKAAVLSDALR